MGCCQNNKDMKEARENMQTNETKKSMFDSTRGQQVIYNEIDSKFEDMPEFEGISHKRDNRRML